MSASIPSIPVDPSRPVRVRIAPSPTGDPHVGTAYVALFNRCFAKKHGGKFILRIEDTDQTRSTRESEAAIFKSLRWCGLDWDEGPDIGGPYGPYRQSERLAIYREHAQILLDKGEAYRCFATPEELEEMRRTQKERGAKQPYDRRYRNIPESEVARLLAEGRPHVVRLKMPIGGKAVITDGLRGEISFDNDELDDQILLKSDGFPTYHLANVVDDRLMQITHVIRAEEWIPSTPKHARLYEAFGWQPPAFIHLPLLRNNDKTKISKRKNPVSLEYYQAAGILPEALLNFLGRMGWSMPDEREKFTRAEMEEAFTFDRMHLGGPIFDLDKLDWLNGLYLREQTPEQLVARLREWLLSDEYLTSVVPLVRERMTRLSEFIPKTSWLFGEPTPLAKEAYVPKGKTQAETWDAVTAIAELVDKQVRWEVAPLEEAFRKLCEQIGWKPKDLFSIVRLVATAATAAPPLFDSLVAIGKARTQVRVRQALTLLKP
ncbi:MAG: glutamate--tRNA ligase [Deltaproteobacteria bacterium]|jgi:glutamyl-tRNA synthetase|nr:glutamate--tRNA ligase [Deltaproteobacteria bacterium]